MRDDGFAVEVGLMVRAYVLDDEPLAVARLTRLLESSGRVEIAGRATDPEEALAFLQRHPVDVLFLDIQMPGLTGFDLIARLDRDIPVVFTTAYDRYALNAFDVNSVDYLLKPIERERLERALDKLERRTTTGDVRALARHLAAELTATRRLERIASRVGERTTVLEVSRITHFFAQDKLTFAASAGRQYVIDYTLSDLEERLDPRRFVRIHRATIVNVGFVQELFPGVDALRPSGSLRVAPGKVEGRREHSTASESRGGMLVRLKDEQKTELSVSRDRVSDLKDRLGI
jgi:two-component system LytT family response regulator